MLAVALSLAAAAAFAQALRRIGWAGMAVRMSLLMAALAVAGTALISLAT